eukprot:TRINITY_DN30908_c0_g1_i1.p1 TRINITY_DN30908_c0_g1~~TRINITY_DN30908_c0_g1_i1.p1  ORF type:complete len:102 (-),score=6.66 TRINITY_DN30908_c0_g1_i1:70-375(-)
MTATRIDGCDHRLRSHKKDAQAALSFCPRGNTTQDAQKRFTSGEYNINIDDMYHVDVDNLEELKRQERASRIPNESTSSNSTFNEHPGALFLRSMTHLINS